MLRYRHGMLTEPFAGLTEIKTARFETSPICFKTCVRVFREKRLLFSSSCFQIRKNAVVGNIETVNTWKYGVFRGGGNAENHERKGLKKGLL